jgi:hypothetical protein
MKVHFFEPECCQFTMALMIDNICDREDKETKKIRYSDSRSGGGCHCNEWREDLNFLSTQAFGGAILISFLLGQHLEFCHMFLRKNIP